MLKLKPAGSLSIDPLESKRLRVVLATIVINVLTVGLLALVPWSNWKTGLALNLFDNVLLLGFIYLHRDGLLLRFVIFGLIVGFAELAADAWLVDYTRTLDYSVGGGPMIWRSPIWMPIAWEIVAVQFGYLGLRLQDHFGPFGLVIIGVLGAVNIPYYEEMARRIHWWQYAHCHMISNTPIYIIVSEGAIAVLLGLAVKKFRRADFSRVALAGLVVGVLIFVTCAIAYGLVDGLFRVNGSA
jgi:hypothetical protein